MSRSNVYASLRRVGRKLGIADVSELLRAAARRRPRPLPSRAAEPVGVTDADLLARCSFPPPGTAGHLRGVRRRRLARAARAGGRGRLRGHRRPRRPRPAARFRPRGRRRRGGRRALGRRVPRRHASRWPTGPTSRRGLAAARYAALPPDVLTGPHGRRPGRDRAPQPPARRGPRRARRASTRRGARCRALRRRETHKLCADLGLQPVHDPSNDDPRFRRNRVRHELLPLLDAIAERDVAAVLARQADLLRADADLLDELSRAVDPTDARALAAAPAPLAARAVRRWLRERARSSTRPTPPPSSGSSASPAARRSACEVGGGRAVRRHAQRLYVADRAG